MAKLTRVMDARRKERRPRGRPNLLTSGFSVETFDRFAADLTSGRTPLKQLTISDNVVSGLRALIRDTGAVSFHVAYKVGGSRPYLMIGTHPQMTVATARKLATTIQSLAAKGIDVQEGLHDRLIRELLEHGDKWRP